MERRRMLGESGGKVIDLSMVDNAGNERSSMTTANCYLIHSEGKYKIPLVYGNAIKNGAVKSVAFYPGSVTNGLSRLLNHAGTGITGPWINKSTSGTGINKGMGLTVSSAELLWQDVVGLITNVGINGNYLTFEVGTFNKGNALIAVKDGSGTILWSWHIWATDDDLSNTTIVATGSHNYTVAPVNLGWVPTGGDGKQGYCPYYQWGRKDPFIPASAYDSNTDHEVYNISGSTVTGFTYQASTTATIADNIKNPTCIYYNSSNYGHDTTAYNNVWDAQNTKTDNVTSATKKTIYDPCPPGFCVPTGNLWYYFGNGNKRDMLTFDSTNKGATWNISITGDELWFPAAGYRNASNSGALDHVGTIGHYWSATPYSSKYYARRIQISAYWTWYFNSRAASYPVRPVAEE